MNTPHRDEFRASGRCPAELTVRELRLLDWLASGRTNAEIGRCACRSEKTIRNQLSRLYEKLGVGNRAGAVAVYLRRR